MWTCIFQVNVHTSLSFISTSDNYPALRSIYYSIRQTCLLNLRPFQLLCSSYMCMKWVHISLNMSACLSVHLSVWMIQLENCRMNFDETLCGHYVIGDYPKLYPIVSNINMVETWNCEAEVTLLPVIIGSYNNVW